MQKCGCFFYTKYVRNDAKLSSEAERNRDTKLKAKKGIKMKREDVSKIFEGATDEQINAILNINSADIGKAKTKAEGERDNYKSQLETATEQLKAFEGVDVNDLQSRSSTSSSKIRKPTLTGRQRNATSTTCC